MVFAENGNGFLAKIEVAPFVGAWIEIRKNRFFRLSGKLLPLWLQELCMDDEPIALKE